MTEDDTFKKLKQVPFRDMVKLLINFLKLTNYHYYTDIPDEFFEKYGWEKYIMLQKIKQASGIEIY